MNWLPTSLNKSNWCMCLINVCIMYIYICVCTIIYVLYCIIIIYYIRRPQPDAGGARRRRLRRRQRQTDRPTDRPTNRQTDGRTDGRTARRTDAEIVFIQGQKATLGTADLAASVQIHQTDRDRQTDRQLFRCFACARQRWQSAASRATFLRASESNVRHWRLALGHAVGTSRPCCFAVSHAPGKGGSRQLPELVF